MVVMSPSLRIGEDFIRFYNVLERSSALCPHPVGMIELGEFPVCAQNITGRGCPWHSEYEIVIFQFHTGISWSL
jgi:hypothetical protein